MKRIVTIHDGIRQLCTLIKSADLHNGVCVYFVKPDIIPHYTIICKRGEETLEFDTRSSLSRACELYLDCICRYA